MRKSNFTSEQIAYRLTQAEAGVPIAELCRKCGVSQQTFHRWKTKFGALTASEVRRLKELEEENSRLKKIVADLSLDEQILQDALRKDSERCRPATLGVGGDQVLRSQRASGPQRVERIAQRDERRSEQFRSIAKTLDRRSDMRRSA